MNIPEETKKEWLNSDIPFDEKESHCKECGKETNHIIVYHQVIGNWSIHICKECLNEKNILRELFPKTDEELMKEFDFEEDKTL